MTYRIRDQIVNTGSSGSNPIYFGRSAYKDVTGGDGYVTIYVSADGYDDTGDGSEGNPFRQPQRALNEIPDGAIGDFIIQCGTGTFEAPYFKGSPGNNGLLRIQIIGDRSSPDIENLGSPSWSNVTNKFAQVTANVGAYGATITDGSHWLERTENSYLRGSTVLASTSPNLNVVTVNNGSEPTSLGNLYPFSTTFDTSTICGTVNELAFWPDDDLRPEEHHSFSFVGIDFDVPSLSLIAGCYLDGCKVRSTIFTRNVKAHIVCEGVYLCSQTIHSETSTLDPSIISGLYGSIRLRASTVGTMQNIVSRYNFGNIHLDSSSVGLASSDGLGYVDFEGGGSFCITTNGSCRLVASNNISISDTPDKFLLLNLGSYFSRGLSATINGQTTDNCVELSDGAQAIGIKAACDGTLTSSGGSEIVVGDAAGTTFANLPITDLGQLCRAT